MSQGQANHVSRSSKTCLKVKFRTLPKTHEHRAISQPFLYSNSIEHTQVFRLNLTSMADADFDLDSQVLDLTAQATAARTLAKEAPEGLLKERGLQAAKTLEAVAKRKSHKCPPGHVVELPASASVAEVKAVRRRRSVRHGEDVYLPTWKDASVGLPKLFLRSALFAAANPGPLLKDAVLAVRDDASLVMTGPQLCDYDRRVFAVCLKHYRNKRLANPESPTWIRTTFWQFAQELDVAYGAQVHRAIRASLIRLNEAALRVRVRRLDLPVPRLVEVAFDDGLFLAGGSDSSLRGSDLIAFRVPDSMAMLFGLNDWSTVRDRVLNEYAGLASWLSAFYSTHSKSFGLPLTEIYAASGSVGDMPAFRRRVRLALEKLQEPETDASVRVKEFVLVDDILTVYLARWPTEK